MVAKWGKATDALLCTRNLTDVKRQGAKRMKGEIELSDTLLNSNINTGLVVDPVTRRISAKNDSEKLFVAKNDHNSTVLSFEIPTYIDGHGMNARNG